MARFHPVLILIAAALLVGVLALISRDWGVAPKPSLIEQVEQRQAETKSQPTTSAKAVHPRAYVYKKRQGLHIDLPYLGGRRLDELSAEVVAEQLGDKLGREELPEDEAHVRFSKAEVWTYDDRIYRIRKKLEHLMDIPTALGTSGYPLDLGLPIDSTNEVRWSHVWNERRLSLIKSGENPAAYEAIEVWRFLPKELL